MNLFIFDVNRSREREVGGRGSGAGGEAWRSSDYMRWSTYADSSRQTTLKAMIT